MDISNALPEIRIYRSPRKGLKLMLLCSPFVGLALYDIIAHAHICPAWLDWISLCFFGLGYPFGLYIIFDRKPQIIINETGIWDRVAYKDFINWNTIEHAYWKTIYKQPFVCLIIKDEYQSLIQAKSKIQELNRSMGFTDITINLGTISSIEKEQLGAFIIAMKDATPIDRSRMLKQHFEKLA